MRPSGVRRSTPFGLASQRGGGLGPGSAEPFEVISGYRSAATNAMLVATTGGVARGSLHVAGMAIDIRVPGRSLEVLRAAATSLRGGGYYPKSNFVHVDVGRIRYW